jgi:hypothetical protein
MAKHGEKTAFGKRFCSRNTPTRSLSHKQLPVAKEHFDRWMEIFTRQQTSYLRPLRKKLNYAPRIWQKCSITKLTILEMLAKWRSSNLK